MKPDFKLLICLVLLLSGIKSYSQQIPEKTLLWRIEGKSIAEPSYIYGTMHLYDQRLFNFGDSVYKALESSKGFANEVDPAVFLDSIFAEIKADKSARLKDMVDEKKYKEISKKLKDKLGIDGEELTSKKIAGKRTAWYYNQRSKDDMDAVVDFYLYDVAKKQGKITGGIEDYADQKDLFDEVGSAIDIEKFANENPATWKKNLNKFIDIYLEQEIENIYRLSSDGKPGDHSKRVLDDRNVKMARNIDSLINIRSTFFAVGAAHLAGDQGLINLLRNHGYRMIPVYSSGKLHAKKYTFKTAPTAWETITADDKSYTVEMPGKASDINISEAVPAFKMYADFGNTLFYMTTAMPAIVIENDTKLTLNKAVERFVEGAKHKTISTRYFTYNGSPAVEVSSAKDEVFFKMNLVLKDKRVYFLLVGAQKKNVLDIPETGRFLQSLKTNDAFIQTAPAWYHFKDPRLAIELDFPGKPVLKKEEQDEITQKTWDVSTYSAADFKTGSYYSMILLETVPGFLITDDSTILKSKIEVFESKDFKLMNQQYFDWDGYPAMKYQAKLKQDGFDFLLDVVTVNRINRNFTAMAVVQDNEQGAADAAKFIKNFRLLRFETASWESRSLPGNIGTAWGPEAFAAEAPDSTEEASDSEGRMYFAIDKNNSVNYSLDVSGFGPYFFRPDEDSLLREVAATFYTDPVKKHLERSTSPTDSLIYVKKVVNGPANGLEVLVKQPAVHHYKKIRIFINGDSLYQLIVFAPLNNLEDQNSKRFFDDFRFASSVKTAKLYTNHSKSMVSDLSSADSATREKAKNALDETVFAAKDLPLLHEALLQLYPNDTVSYYHIHSMLVDKIAAIKDPSSVAFVEKEYAAMAAAKDERSVNLLQLLAEIKTAESYGSLKKWWLSFPPASAGPYALSGITDSLELTATLFPDLQALYADTITGGTLIDAAADLLDSNKITKENIFGNSPGLYAHANWQLNKYNNDKEYYNYNTYPLLKLLAALNTKESIALLTRFTKIPDADICMDATARLIEKDIVVSSEVLEKLASGPNQRIPLFEAFKKAGKGKQFPKKYYNQVSFAESQLAELAVEEDIYLKQIKLVSTHKYDGAKAAGLYYSFKITDEEAGSYLGFIGPYSKDQLQQSYADLRYQLLYDVPLNKAAVNSAFKNFIKESLKE